MGPHPHHHPFTDRTKITRQYRCADPKDNVCPEAGCSRRFKRKSDLERHRKCVHHCAPALGDSDIYQCRVAGCDSRRSRLDHFKKHARQAHPDWNPEKLSHESAVPLTGLDNANVTGPKAPRRQLDGNTASASHASSTIDVQSTLDNSDDGDLHHWGEASSTDDHTGQARSSITEPWSSHAACNSHGGHRVVYDQYSRRAPGDPNALVPRAVVDLLRRVQAYHRAADQASHTRQLPTHDGCEVPVDGDGYNYGQASGQVQGFSSSGAEASGSGRGPGKGKQPMRDQGNGHGGEGGGPPDPGPNEPNGAAGGPPKIFPCVFCLFYGPAADPSRDCSTRKPYICNLWPHHYRHHLFCCWKCFGTFDTREETEAHRRESTCQARCVIIRCRNYNKFPTAARPCGHGNSNTSLAVWQRLYRQAHGLTRNDWVPDPTRATQNIPPVLPPHHPMHRFLLQNQFPNVPHPAPHGLPIPGPQGPDLLVGQGGWMDNAGPANALPGPVAPAAVPGPFELDRLRYILANLWDCLNTRTPAWRSALARDQFWASIPPDTQLRFGVDSFRDLSKRRALEYEAAHFALLIEGQTPRTLEVWADVNHIARRHFPEHVVYPMECPWDLERTPDPGLQGRLFIGRATLPVPEIDPVLQQLSQTSTSTLDNLASFPSSQSSMPTMNDITSFTSSAGRDHQNSIPRVTRDALTSSWVTRPSFLQTPSHDRRQSLTSLTSPSDGAFYSAHSPSSFVLTPARDGTPRHVQAEDTTPSRFQAYVDSIPEDPVEWGMRDPDEMDEDEGLEGID